MIRFLLLPGIFLALTVSLAVDASSAATKPKIIVGGDHDCPPYEFLENGKPTGFDIELMRAVADVMGFDVEFRLGPWIKVRQDLEQGGIDALAGMYYSVDRSRLVDFSVPHTLVTSGLFVRKDSSISSFADIQGKEIIVQEGDIIHDALKWNGLASRIVAVTEAEQVLKLLGSGKHDCALMPSRLQGEHYVKTLGIANIRIINTGLPQLQYCFAVRKGNQELLYQLDEGLKILKVNGKYREIHEKWFGVYEEKDLWDAVRYYVLAIALAAVLCLVFLVWSRMLKRRVKQRTAELRRSEEALRFTQYAIDNAADQAFWMTEDGRLFYVNAAACRALGYSREELVGMSISDIDPAYPPEAFAEHWCHLQNQGPITLESLHRAKDGRVYPVEIRANYVVFDGKEYNCAFATDISERKRMEDELRHARDELEKRVEERTRELAQTVQMLRFTQFAVDRSVDQAFWITNEGRFFYVNDAACTSLGYTRDELVTMSVPDIDPTCPPEMVPQFWQVLRENGTDTFETCHRTKDGRDYPVEIRSNLLVFDGTEYNCCFVTDITERKRAEEALRESESRVRRKLESILDPEGDIGELDLADILNAPEIKALMEDLYRTTGLKMSIIDLQGQVLVDVGWQDICSRFHRNHPETLKRCHESDTGLAVGVPPGEFRTYRCKNNMWHLVTPIIVGGRHMGNLFLGQFFFADEKLDYDLFRFQARTYGFPEEEYIAVLEAVPRHSKEFVNLGKAVFLRLTDMFSKLSYANIKLAHSLAERDRLTETLREANLVAENSPAVLFRWKGDDTWPVELVSGNIKQFGYAPDDFLSGSITYSSIIHPDDLERVTREVHDFCDGGTDQFHLEYRIVTKGGDVRWVNEHSNIERDAEGGVKNFEGIVIDVTERKKAEDAIRESRAKYQAIVDSFDGLIYIASQDYRIEFMNRKLIERTGRDAVGDYCYKVMNGLDSVCPWCINDRVFAGETVHREMYSPKDNRWYYAVNVPIRHAGGAMSKHSMIFDITERKLFEEELQRQKKLLQELNETLERRVGEEVAKNREKDIMLIQQNRQAALGDLLDHIAHQWKQPLTVISLLVQSLWPLHARNELTPEKIRETIDKATALLEHMAQTIEDFRDFYRPDKEKTAFLISDTVDNALAFISPALKYQSVAVELDVDPGLLAMGYPREYTQVLLNVLSNARDALRERKTEKPKITIRGFAEGSRAVVTITDNAGGIPESIAHNIFDLYVTTKEASGGTGIGLHMSKNIIEKNMDGSLTAHNTDSGAQFRIAVNMLQRKSL